MNTRYFLAMLVATISTWSITLAEQPSAQPAPGAGQPAAGGKGPGMGYYYRRNMGGPGMRGGAQPGGAPASRAQWTAQPPTPPLRAAPPAFDPSRQTPPQAAFGYRRYPGWAPGTTRPYGGQSVPRYRQPGRQGYGYPGYRGQGGSQYPGHRQYGNPPGIPPGMTNGQ